MTLRKYLEDNGIDQIKDDQTFMEEEYHAVRKYCETCGYLMTGADLDVIKARGLEETFTNWKTVYVEELWEEFGKPWRLFPTGTHREDVWHWFEESFGLSVAEDLMRAGGKTKLCQGK